MVEHAEHTEAQFDGRIQTWAWIPEADGYLRVIMLPDGEAVHKAFFDRAVREKSR